MLRATRRDGTNSPSLLYVSIMPLRENRKALRTGGWQGRIGGDRGRELGAGGQGTGDGWQHKAVCLQGSHSW